MNAQQTGPKSTGYLTRKHRSVAPALAALVIAAGVLSGSLLIGKSSIPDRFAVRGGSPYPLNELLADTVSTTRALSPSLHTKLMATLAAIPSPHTFLKALDSSGAIVGFEGVTFSNSDIASGGSHVFAVEY